MKVFSPFLNGDTTTSGSLTLPQHPTASAITNPNTGSIYHDTTDGVVRVYTGTQWQVVGEQTASAAPVVLNTDIEYLLIAGGGAGGNNIAAGGGAGGYLSSSLSSVTSGSTFTVTVGSGGTGGGTSQYSGASGTDSSIAGATISTITATGGGGGAGNDNTANGAAKDGGSGGGGSYGNTPGGSGTVGQGNDGGDGYNTSFGASGGGGGAGAAGSNATNTNAGGAGGAGLASSITGTSVTRAGGGGGGDYNGTGGSGGSGGGGNGGYGTSANAATDPTAGTVNTGGGGGGAGWGSAEYGASGGSGVAIFAYDSGSFNAAGGIVGDAGNGRKYHQFNSSDTFKVGSTSDFQIVTDSLMVHYDAGNFASRGTSTWTDLKGNYNSTVTGATLGSNFYYDFDGSNDYMTNSIAYSSGGTYTFCWWMNADTSGTGVYFICEYNSDDSYMIHLGGASGTNGIRVAKDATSANLDTSGAYTTGTWEYFCAVWHPNYCKLYKNGSLLNSNSDTTNTPAATGHQIGRRLTGGASLYFNGKIGMIHIYSKELSADEALQNYNATKTNFV